jgi:Tol biopolymer transport system component
MDGSKIVFQRARNGKDEIWMMNSNGEKLNPLGWEGRRPDYSPTRDEIVFESDVRGISNIFRGTVGKKEIENLTKATKMENACFSPSFSPDGEWILFHRKRKGLWVMKRDGTKQRQILPENFATMMGRISPDGMYLAVCAGNELSKGNLYLYTACFKFPRKLVDPVR